MSRHSSKFVESNLVSNMKQKWIYDKLCNKTEIEIFRNNTSSCTGDANSTEKSQNWLVLFNLLMYGITCTNICLFQKHLKCTSTTHNRVLASTN